MPYPAVVRRLCLVTTLLAPLSARADGGEVSLGTHYAPSVTRLRAADATWDAPGVTYAFDHVVGVDVVYALSNRVGVGVDGQLLWPQDFVAHNVNWRAAGGQIKEDATVALRELQLNVGGVLVLKTDRRQHWDLSLTLGAGLQATRWEARGFTVKRRAGPQSVPDNRTAWRLAPVYHAAPQVSWRLGQRLLLAIGPRVDVTQNGTLRFSALAQVAVPLAVGPSF